VDRSRQLADAALEVDASRSASSLRHARLDVSAPRRDGALRPISYLSDCLRRLSVHANVLRAPSDRLARCDKLEPRVRV
jgi:hypothetical protein